MPNKQTEDLKIFVEVDIDQAIQAMDSLQKRSKELEEQVQGNFQNITTASGKDLDKQIKDVNAAKNSYKSLQKAIETVQKVIASKVPNLQQEVDKILNSKQGSKGWVTKRQKQIDALLGKYKLTREAAKELGISFDKDRKKDDKPLTPELDKIDKKSKKAGKSHKKNFLDVLKRVAVYRVARLAIQKLGEGLLDGVKAFAMSDSQMNQSMSNIVASFSAIRNAISIGLGTALQAVEPIVTSFADNMLDVANSFSAAVASARGSKTYMKAIKDDSYDFSQNIEKATASFDKFETLSGNTNQIRYEEVAVGDGLNKTGETTYNTFSQIVEVVKEVWAVIKEIAPACWEIVLAVLNVFNSVLKATNELGITKEIVVGILAAFIALKSINLFQNLSKALTAFNTKLNTLNISWKQFGITMGIVMGTAAALSAIWSSNMSVGAKLILTVLALAAAFATLAVTKQAGTAKHWAEALVAVSSITTALIASAAQTKKIKGYAMGGFPETGAMFIANERGPELIGRIGNRTAVINNDQIIAGVSSGVYNAVVAAMGNNKQSNMNVFIDGKKVGVATANSSYGEMKRVGLIK